ncbi:MAG: hypothetical protein HFE78_05805 [Clostridiales bacterium]|nr:hypothetical protein [Clostridiales bacterium]
MIKTIENEWELLCVKVCCDPFGNPIEQATFSSKSGDNFNHQAEWNNLSKKQTNGKQFNYYPRGRVELKNGKAVVYLNPALNTHDVKIQITEKFGLTKQNGILSVAFKSDGSRHYESLIQFEM